MIAGQDKNESFYKIAETTNLEAKKSINKILDETRKRGRRLYH